ncbi:uncharacterized protein LOC142976562 [Anticarsia gemmatalis]|uniref:uncharacterized protein LOC142976562 n=1 Tax=Anticarsia gemmatalis TaxID=129554 RepID=UPI003F76E3D0
MKYSWPKQNVSDSVNMQTGNEDFVVRTEYNLKMIENLQKTSPKKVKRFRSAFTTDQVNYLEKQFKKFPYIGNAHRKDVAVALNIPERAVKIWFQNRRMKEKKESTSISKEFDDEPTNRKSQEFAKDQLNNVATSANEQKPYSLTLHSLLTDGNKTNRDNIMTANNTTCLTTGVVKDSGFTVIQNAAPNVVNTRPAFESHQTISPNNFTKPEFSIDICKKFKNEADYTTPLSVQEHHEVKHNTEQKPLNYTSMEQMVPEDLSSSRKINIPIASQMQVPNNLNNQGYISVVPTMPPFYAQPYYSASGVVWKPVNVVPTVAAPVSSVPVTGSIRSVPVQESAPKKCCCDCHVNQVPLNFPQQSQSPQYIITAVQFPNPSAKF